MTISSPIASGTRAGELAAVVLGDILRPLRSPLRRIAVRRMPAIADPAALTPGAAPPTGGRVLVLYDGACGICLHGRDLLARIDHHGQLAHDVLQRHADGLLADLPADELAASWHVIAADGRREERGQALATVLGALPGGRVLGPLARAAMPLTDRGYRWFATHRAVVSQHARLGDHPDRDASLA